MSHSLGICPVSPMCLACLFSRKTISRIYWHARLLRRFDGGTALNIFITRPEQSDGSASDRARLGETWLVRRLGEVVPKGVVFGLYLTPKKSRPHYDRWKRQSWKGSTETFCLQKTRLT